MILLADGVLHDTDRRDLLIGGAGADVFTLCHDGKTEVILGFQDGTDLIDISSFDASWDELTVRQLSLTEYVVTYQGEERIRITFAEPAPEAIPVSGWLLDEDDFIYHPGLPVATPQVILEASSTEKEVIYGTTRPDVFVFTDDGQRDTIRLFEPGKDVIDLASYGTSFGELRITERKEGRISVKVPGTDGHDWLVIVDASRDLTAEDITPDMFLF